MHVLSLHIELRFDHIEVKICIEIQDIINILAPVYFLTIQWQTGNLFRFWQT